MLRYVQICYIQWQCIPKKYAKSIEKRWVNGWFWFITFPSWSLPFLKTLSRARVMWLFSQPKLLWEGAGAHSVMSTSWHIAAMNTLIKSTDQSSSMIIFWFTSAQISCFFYLSHLKILKDVDIPVIFPHVPYLKVMFQQASSSWGYTLVGFPIKKIDGLSICPSE